MARTSWTLDPSHSEIQFKVKHLMITNVTGEFSKYEVNVETEDEDFTKADVSFTAAVNSVSPRNEQRDGHLKSADFFDTEKYPEIRFKGTKYENVDNDGSYELYGDLTIKDVTKSVKLD